MPLLHATLFTCWKRLNSILLFSRGGFIGVNMLMKNVLFILRARKSKNYDSATTINRCSINNRSVDVVDVVDVEFHNTRLLTPNQTQSSFIDYKQYKL